MDLSKKPKSEVPQETDGEMLLEPPYDGLIEAHSKDVLHSWRAPEFEVVDRNRRWYIGAVLILTAIIAYAVITNNPITAITFILILVVGYLLAGKKPQLIDFSVTHKGLIADRELYDFENIHSFWIFYDPPHTKILSLRMKHSLFPFVHIPIASEDPSRLRQILLAYSREEKQHWTLVDTLARMLHM